MNIEELKVYAVLLCFLGMLFCALFSLLLWYSLKSLSRKLDRLHDHCLSCRRQVAAALAGRLEHDAEHSGLWEAVHYHEHGRTKRAFHGASVVGQG